MYILLNKFARNLKVSQTIQYYIVDLRIQNMADMTYRFYVNSINSTLLRIPFKVLP